MASVEQYLASIGLTQAQAQAAYDAQTIKNPSYLGTPELKAPNNPKAFNVINFGAPSGESKWTTVTPPPPPAQSYLIPSATQAQALVQTVERNQAQAVLEAAANVAKNEATQAALLNNPTTVVKGGAGGGNSGSPGTGGWGILSGDSGDLLDPTNPLLWVVGGGVLLLLVATRSK